MSMTIAYYDFDEVGISDLEGWQGGSFDGRVEVVVLGPASTENYPAGDRTVAIHHRARFALGKVEIAYRLLDPTTQKWRTELREPPEYIQYDIRSTLYWLHYDRIEELLDHSAARDQNVA